ncbi:MAG: LPXTG cell wall anchor domain-containing protein [Sporichthyaceae bacterium]
MASKRTRHAVLGRAALAGGAALLVAAAAIPAAAADNPDPFAISGGASELLYPGASVPLDLSLFNPNNGLLALTSLTARIDSVQTVGQGSCTIDDFVVDNVLAFGTIVVPPGATNLLSELGLPVLGMPRVRMLNTDYNQDGCKQATVHLVYEGAGLTEETDGGNGGGGHTPGHGHSGGGETGNGHLPGTGATQAPWWIAAAGLGLAGIGTGALRLTRRNKGEYK